MASEIANRIAKAQRIADAFADYPEARDDVLTHDPEGVTTWATVAGVATEIGETEPSDETVEIVVAILRERNRDPFEGLV